jgi:hypothetical protein
MVEVVNWRTDHVLVFEHLNGRTSEFPCDAAGTTKLTWPLSLYYEDYNNRRDSFRRVYVQKREWCDTPRRRKDTSSA